MEKGETIQTSIERIQDNGIYGVENIGKLFVAILTIVVLAYNTYTKGFSAWKVIISPIKFYDMLKSIYETIQGIPEVSEMAWREIKDFKYSEVDDLLLEFVNGIKNLKV